jgi:hypothetical protein
VPGLDEVADAEQVIRVVPEVGLDEEVHAAPVVQSSVV